jgi:cell division protein ZapA (FtsZ GTPase activity inhibitor)
VKPATSKRLVTVRIAGQAISLRTDADDGYVTTLCALVESRILALREATKTVATHQVAIMAALSLAEDLLAERQAARALKRQVRARSKAILSMLPEELTR